MLSRIKAAFAIFLLTCTVAASAQDYSPLAEFATTIGTTTSQSHAMGDVFRDVYGKSASSSGKSSHAPISTGSALSQLNYSPTSTLTKAAIEKYVASIRPSDPAGANRAVNVLGNANISQVYQSIVAPFGLRDGNLADSFTAYSVLGWMIANNPGNPSQAQVLGTRNKFAMQLASNPTLSNNIGVTGEELKILFVTLDAGWQAAQKQGKTREYSDAVAAMFAQRGLDFRKLDLTTKGFAFKK